METLIFILIILIALAHFAFMVLEMFLWDKAIGRKTFKLSQQQANNTKVLAANQGLYNGFLAIGLVWSAFHPNAHFAEQLALFFLSCVVAAGVYGAITADKSIFFIQALPAAITFALIAWA